MTIIPLPNNLKLLSGNYTDQSRLITFGPHVQPELADLLCQYLQGDIASPDSATCREATVFLKVENPGEEFAMGINEAYALSILPECINLNAKTNSGLARGIQALRQLATQGFPCCEIEDEPAFQWRGLHLDVSRHFFSVKEVCHFIDVLALHRLNVCHLHLTDDQGWRIEIKQFPKLTSVGSKRSCTLIGHLRNRPRRYDDQAHSGFFTQDDIREIVEFASQRHVLLVPEIDMPGHMQAAITAYPEWGCTDQTIEPRCHWGISQHILNTETTTVSAMCAILDEVIALFPGQYVHIGGDEAVKHQWSESRRTQDLMAERGLRDEQELQSWFIQQIADHLQTQGRKMIGWEEIMEGGVAEGAVVMSWRGEDAGAKAANSGHDVVMAPQQYVYFDHYQAEPVEDEPLAIGGLTTTEKVYGYPPIPAEVEASSRHHVLGAQGQLWTEYIPDLQLLFYMTYPRACALAEVLWTKEEKRYFQDFLKRLTGHRHLLATQGIHSHPEPAE